MRFLNIPSLEPRPDLVLIWTQKEDINILMLSCFSSEEEIELCWLLGPSVQKRAILMALPIPDGERYISTINKVTK